MKDQDTLAARERVAAMTFGQKLKHYLGYYKIHIIVGTIVVALLVFFIRSLVLRQDNILYIGTLDGYFQKPDTLITEYCDYVNAGPKETIELRWDYSRKANTGEGGFYSAIQISLAAKQIDVIFVSEEDVTYISKSGVALNVNDWMTEEWKEKWSDRIGEFDTLLSGTGMDEEDVYSIQPVAVDLSGTKAMEHWGLSEDTCYMMVINNTPRLEGVQKFCDYISSLESQVEP